MPPFETDLRRSFEPRAAFIGDSWSLSSRPQASRTKLRSVGQRAGSRASVAFGQFRDYPHGRNGGNNDMEGAAERKLSAGLAARTSLSRVTPTSFEFWRSAPG